MRNDIAYLPPPGGVATEAPLEPSAEATVTNVNSLIQRVAGTSLAEIENLISELESLRDLLHAEGQRVQREISGYAQLSQAAMKSTRMICRQRRSSGSAPPTACATAKSCASATASIAAAAFPRERGSRRRFDRVREAAVVLDARLAGAVTTPGGLPRRERPGKHPHLNLTCVRRDQGLVADRTFTAFDVCDLGDISMESIRPETTDPIPLRPAPDAVRHDHAALRRIAGRLRSPSWRSSIAAEQRPRHRERLTKLALNQRMRDLRGRSRRSRLPGCRRHLGIALHHHAGDQHHGQRRGREDKSDQFECAAVCHGPRPLSSAQFVSNRQRQVHN